MENTDLRAARQYHDGTKHPNGFLLDPAHRFGPQYRPEQLFKQILNLPRIPLPLDQTPAGMSALEAISSVAAESSSPKIPDLAAIARLLYFSAGITKRIHYPSYGDEYFRAAACTGALYHIELYLVCGDLPDLEAGVYHFDPVELALVRLRSGDFRRYLYQASGSEPSLRSAPAVLAYTDVFWRNAVKYQAREYRHAFWDSGTILSHTLAMAAVHELPARLITGFADLDISRLLALNPEEELPLALLSIGSQAEQIPPESPEFDELQLETRPVSTAAKRFPAIGRMHNASSLPSPEAVIAWRKQGWEPSETPARDPSPSSAAGRLPLDPYPQNEMPGDPLEKVILRRGSTRRFSGEQISVQELSTILHTSMQGIPADFLDSDAAAFELNQAYLIVNGVSGLPSGTYAYHPESGELEVLRSGQFRSEAGSLALGQALAADASANVYFLADLEKVFNRFGNRGYRLAQLEASITAGKMYLAAYALRRGATGLTFYDDAVTDFFKPHAGGKSVMFLIALGVPARRK